MEKRAAQEVSKFTENTESRKPDGFEYFETRYKNDPNLALFMNNPTFVIVNVGFNHYDGCPRDYLVTVYKKVNTPVL